MKAEGSEVSNKEEETTAVALEANRDNKDKRRPTVCPVHLVSHDVRQPNRRVTGSAQQRCGERTCLVSGFASVARALHEIGLSIGRSSGSAGGCS